MLDSQLHVCRITATVLVFSKYLGHNPHQNVSLEHTESYKFRRCLQYSTAHADSEFMLSAAGPAPLMNLPRMRIISSFCHLFSLTDSPLPRFIPRTALCSLLFSGARTPQLQSCRPRPIGCQPLSSTTGQGAFF